MTMRDFNVICAATEDYQFDYYGTNRILGVHDTIAGEVCYKDGATTGLSRGRIGFSEAWMFKDEAAGTNTQGSAEISKAKILTFHQMDINDGLVCADSDSGCALFVPVPEMEGWAWTGQLIGLMRTEHSRTVGFMVPASQLLQSLKECTGFSWELTS